MKLLHKLLEKSGRVYALVDFTGNIIAYRYFLFLKETPGQDDDFWPNAYVQRHLDPRGLDGSSGMITTHNHPWSAVAILLKGGYTELRNGIKIPRIACAGYFISYEDSHAVIDTKPETISVFAHWFKKKDWGFTLAPCDTLCKRCEADYGQCEKTLRKAPLSDMVDASANSRKQSWQKVDADFWKRNRKRKAAIKRMGLEPTVVDPIKMRQEKHCECGERLQLHHEQPDRTGSAVECSAWWFTR